MIESGSGTAPSPGPRNPKSPPDSSPCTRAYGACAPSVVTDWAPSGSAGKSCSRKSPFSRSTWPRLRATITTGPWARSVSRWVRVTEERSAPGGFLGGGIEEADGLDGVAQEVEAARFFVGCRVQVHDPAADGVLAGVLHHRHLMVADLQKPGDEVSPFDRGRRLE